MFEHAKHLENGGTCELCKKPISKNAEGWHWLEKVSFLRGEDVQHLRHNRCHKEFEEEISAAQDEVIRCAQRILQSVEIPGDIVLRPPTKKTYQSLLQSLQELERLKKIYA